MILKLPCCVPGFSGRFDRICTFARFWYRVAVLSAQPPLSRLQAAVLTDQQNYLKTKSYPNFHPETRNFLQDRGVREILPQAYN
jgi:hypothetical protein